MQICEYYDVAKHALTRILPDDSTLIDYGLKNPSVSFDSILTFEFESKNYIHLGINIIYNYKI